MPASPFLQYVARMDQLRRARRACGDDLAMLDNCELPILEAMDVLWEKMSAEERADARRQSWRAWPGQFDAHAREMPTELPKDDSCTTPK